MTIPTDLMHDGLSRTLRLALKALDKRLKREGDYRAKTPWSYHHGGPSDDNLPKENLSVWLAFSSLRQGSNAPARSEYFIARWTLKAVIKDGGNDPYGFDQNVMLDVVDDIVSALTKELNDIALDGAIDFIDDIILAFNVGQVAPGDQTLGLLEMNFDTHLPLMHTRKSV